MKIKCPQSLLTKIANNKFLSKKCEEFKSVCGQESEEITKFLDENPEFIQIVTAYAKEIEIIDD